MWERPVRWRRVFVLREAVEAARCASGGLSEGWGWETIRPGALCMEKQSASPEVFVCRLARLQIQPGNHV